MDAGPDTNGILQACVKLGIAPVGYSTLGKVFRPMR